MRTSAVNVEGMEANPMTVMPAKREHRPRDEAFAARLRACDLTR